MHPCLSLFLIDFEALRLATLLDTPVQLFSCEFCEIFLGTFLQNTSERLILDLTIFGLIEPILKYFTFQPLVHGIGAKLISSWEQKMLYTKSSQNL